MMFDRKFLSDEVFNNIRSNYFSNIIYWIIDNNYRNSVRLTKWLEPQVTNPTPAVQDVANNIMLGTNYDYTVMSVLKWVKNNITYIRDSKKWSMPEKWCTADETLTATVTTSNGTFYPAMSGDCEDGAVLAYVLCRLKGVPINRLLLMCGDVVEGGHCWLAYKPEQMPINFVFLDWCYDYDANTVSNRTIFYLDDRKIIGSEPHNYLELWFAFSEKDSYYTIKY